MQPIHQSIFKNVDLLGEGGGVVLAFPRLGKEVKRLVNALVSGELSAFPAAWVNQFPDFNSPANRLKILCRQQHDFEVLKLVFSASRALFAPLPLAAVPDHSLVHYLNNPACSLLSPFLLGIGILGARNIKVASFHAFFERPDMHYKRFASVDHIAEQIAGWSRLQVLQITYLGHILGWILCLLLEEHRGTEQDTTEYVEAATLVLLLCGLRPLLQAVVGAVQNHSNATVQQAFLPAVQLGLERETRAPRKLARDAAVWAQVYFEESEKVLTLEEAREHVRWTNAYVQIQEATSDQEGVEEGWRVGEEEMKDLVRVDMLFAARRTELLGTLSEGDLRSGSKLAGEIAAEALR